MSESANVSSNNKLHRVRKRSTNTLVLSDEQQLFVEKALERNNILVDACIGSGKTTAIQYLCDKFPDNLSILYLTYNKLLKLDARSKIKNKNVTVTNYHGFASAALRKAGFHSSVQELVHKFNQIHPPIFSYDILIIDEYQDIEQAFSEMLEYIKSRNPNIQLIAVGDMAQKIYNRSQINVPEFIDSFLGEHLTLHFTNCFRLSSGLADFLGRVWKKEIHGVNTNCLVRELSFQDTISILAEADTRDILCLGRQENGDLTRALNLLEEKYPQKFNKRTTYASIRQNDNIDAGAGPKKTSAIFTTYDSSKGLERKICAVFDFTESYWFIRKKTPLQSYQILRNIFCVAASRGKEQVIFVKSDSSRMLSEHSLSTAFQQDQLENQLDISHMFEYRDSEKINHCTDLLEKTPLSSDDISVIDIQNKDGLIDLSPCIGIYQEAAFFKQYSIDTDIQLDLNSSRSKVSDVNLYANDVRNASLDEKILFLTYLETRQERYRTQVNIPFVSDMEHKEITDRLSTLFTPDEVVQSPCKIAFSDQPDGNVIIIAQGRTDVIKDNIVYELKFVSELANEHFLQCACYMVALGLKKGILWNVKKNTKFEITIPDEKKFLDAVTDIVTQGEIKEYYKPATECCTHSAPNNALFAVIDTETNYSNQVMSIGIVIANKNTFEIQDTRYYILTPESNISGMYSNALHLADIPITKICNRETAINEILAWLASHHVDSIFAYNAAFDRKMLPEFYALLWHDIMKIAAYRQFNSKISSEMECMKNGRLKRNFGVESILKMLFNDNSYVESHNALKDALDELRIMQLLEQPLFIYQKYARLSYEKAVQNTQTLLNNQSNSRVVIPHRHDAFSCASDTTNDNISVKQETQYQNNCSNSDIPYEQFYTVSDIMSMFNISRNQVYNLIHSGLLPANKKANKYVITQQSVDNYRLYLEQQRRSVFYLACAFVIFFILILLCFRFF